jgi:dihydroneopterin aldolase
LLTIHLHNLCFKAYHGLYKEEQLLGNDFEVNISINHLPSNEKIVSIEQTINYVAVYELVKQRMQQPTPLLETLAQEICEAILNKFPLAMQVHFSIKKLNPPIVNFQGSVGISFEMRRDA